jgi:hypothetical protein
LLVSIVYDSGYGHTARVAEAVAEGVREVEGTEAKLVAVADGAMDWNALERSDAIIFGSPTYNGLISAKLKQFFEDLHQSGLVGAEVAQQDRFRFHQLRSPARRQAELARIDGAVCRATRHDLGWSRSDAGQQQQHRQHRRPQPARELAWRHDPIEC